MGAEYRCMGAQEVGAVMVYLERFCDSPWGVFGRLQIGDREWYTLEPPWLGNRPRVSCIPAGVYPLILGRYNRGGYDTYEVCDVPGRSLIKLHAANVYTELAGCVAPGKSLGMLRGLWAVQRSRQAHEEIMEALGGMAATIIDIRWRIPEVEETGVGDNRMYREG